MDNNKKRKFKPNLSQFQSNPRALLCSKLPHHLHSRAVAIGASKPSYQEFRDIEPLTLNSPML